MYRFNQAGRIVSTLEPLPRPGPLLTIVRSPTEVVWAVNQRVPSEVAALLDHLAATEPPLRAEPIGPEPPRYREQLREALGSPAEVAGPLFEFPELITAPSGVTFIDSASQLSRHLSVWTESEMPGRLPAAAIWRDGWAVSLCACARRTIEAAEASLETAPDWRGQGLAERVTAAWAIAVRESGRLPLYSTSWDNKASRAVARKLGLRPYAANWRLYEE